MKRPVLPRSAMRPELTAVLAEVTSAVSDVLAFLPVTEKQLRQPAEVAEYLDTEGDYEMETAIERWLAESAVVNNLGFFRYGTGTAHNQMRTCKRRAPMTTSRPFTRAWLLPGSKVA